jgi:polysaccharide biosynthesis transport protein
MLHATIPFPAAAECGCPCEASNEPGSSAGTDYFFAAVRRQRALFMAMVCIFVAAGLAFLWSAQPLYTADAYVLIDNRRVRAVESAYDASEAASEIATSMIDSQAEIARAGKVTARVIMNLGLLNDPEFASAMTPKQGAFDEFQRGAMEMLGLRPAAHGGGDAAMDEQSRMQNAVRAVEKNVEARRVARTMVLQISYTSANPAQAARLANAYADAYLAEQLDAKFDATRKASQWLEDRIAELKTKVLNSDLAVQRFRAEHGLIVSSGKLVNEQQLSEINTQLVTVQGETAQAEARHQRIDAIIRNRQTNAIISEAIGNVVIEQLRAKYLEASKRYSELAAKLGEAHLAALSLKAEKDEYEKLMFEELGVWRRATRARLRSLAAAKNRSKRASREWWN